MLLLDFVYAVIKARTELDMSIDELAEKAGVSVKQLTKFESNGDPLRLNEYARILNVFNKELAIVNKKKR